MNNLEQIVCQYYKDKNGNPMSYHIRRKHQISPKNYQIQLDGIPDEYRGIEVIEPIGLYRVENADEITEDSYWVRDDGNVFFHESRACQNVMLDYYSIGFPVVGAGRIYTLLDEEGNVIETLEDILEKGKTVIEALKTMSDVIVTINDLKTSTYEAIKVISTLDNTIDKGYELLAKLNAVEYVQKPEFNKTIENVNNKINQQNEDNSKKNNLLNVNIDNLGEKNYEGYLNDETNSLYKYDKMRLLNGVYSFYGEKYYPSIKLNNDGKLSFTGIAKITTQPNIDKKYGMIELCKIYHIPYENQEGVPLTGTVIGVNDDDFNDRIEIPILLLVDGTILVKNIGYPNKYFSRIEFSNTIFNTTAFGEDVIQDYLNSKISNIINDSWNSKCQFIYFTDLHNNIYDYRRYATLKAIKKIESMIFPNFIASGGDNINEPYRFNDRSTKLQALMAHKQVYDSFSKDKFIYTNGNHDNNASQNYPNNSNTTIYPKDIKPFFNNSKFIFGGENKFYGYYDDESSKVRVVVLDAYESLNSGAANVSFEQLQWIGKNALNLKDKPNWGIIVISHISPIDNIDIVETLIPNRVVIRNIFESFKNGTDCVLDSNTTLNFSQQGAKDIYIWLFGHNHFDSAIKINGINYVSTGLAWSTDTKIGKRVQGTPSQYCFDIISILDKERKVKLERIGIGENREFIY